ncbi:MAG: response regulator [Magnetococcales bacterium]|nr:response regulator [Magnetococcales bacterium]MBF0321720.1 response regulator [Magnetococcales bacterium]
MNHQTENGIGTTPAVHILVVDDDPDIRELVGSSLEREGYRVSTSPDGQGLERSMDQVDLVILDLVLPGDDGLVLCRNLRARSTIPVIILSSRGEEMDRIIGLEMGADDYLPKPFHPRELLARVKSVLRRTRLSPTPATGDPDDVVYSFSGWTLDALSRNLTSPQGDSVALTGSEHHLLTIFLGHPNRVLSRDQLLDLTRGREIDHFDRTIDMQVSRLRRRLGDDPRSPQLIKTVRSAGYVFCSRVEKGRGRRL